MSSRTSETEHLEAVENADALFEEFADAEFEEDFRELGINPGEPTPAKPGSNQKVIMLAARYAAGLPLWHTSDCYDHGPGGSNGPNLANLMFGANEEEEETEEVA